MKRPGSTNAAASYYLSYADNHSDPATGDNQMRYATSSNPLGPWTSRGIVMKPTDSYCAHGSIVQFGDQWYVFYFNSAISKNDWLRSICVDRLYYNSDGTIKEVVQTADGVPAVGTPEPAKPVLSSYEAEDAVLSGGATVVADAAASKGKAVQNLHLANASIRFNGVDGGTGGRATIHLYYASDETAKVRLTVNDTDFSYINTLATGGWSGYGGHSYFTVPIKAGTSNTITLSGGSGGVNIDRITLTGFARPVAIAPKADDAGRAASATLRPTPQGNVVYRLSDAGQGTRRVHFELYDVRGRCLWKQDLVEGFAGGEHVLALPRTTAGVDIVRMRVVNADGAVTDAQTRCLVR